MMPLLRVSVANPPAMQATAHCRRRAKKNAATVSSRNNDSL